MYLATFQPFREVKQARLSDLEGLSIELTEKEHLGPPVLGVRGGVLQSQEGVAGCLHGKTSNAVTPFLCCTLQMQLVTNSG